jgi:hypothetical protein
MRRPLRTTLLPRLSRRTLLRGAAGAAIALPFLDAMRTRARAQTPGIRRLIFEFKPNGDEVDRRFDTVHETDFVLGEFLAPLEPYRDDLLFVHRINKNYHRLESDEQGDRHQVGCASLAPWPFSEGDFPVGGEERTIGYVLGPSADYVIGDRVLAATPEVPYRHLVYRVGDAGNDIWNMQSHAGPVGTKNPILPETDPYSAYARLFGFFDSEESEAELIHNLNMNKSVLDLVHGQLGQLGSQLGAEDRSRLELHAEAIRDLERTLAAGTQSAQCQALDLGDPVQPYDQQNHVQIAEAFFKIIALSFACDLSRVASFNWHGSVSQRIYANLDLVEGHHDISHKSDTDAFGQIRAIHRHLWQNTTSLYEELLTTPEGEGSLWDHTAIVHWNELGQGDGHTLHDVLTVIAGGAEGFFEKGRLLDLESGGSFTDLLVAAFHYMGFDDVTEFGDPRLSDGQGPLPGLIA